MNEDGELIDFVRKRLEDDVSAEPPRFAEIMREAASRAAARRAKLWLRSSVAAASLAMALCMAVVCMRREGPSPESTVADVIDILCVSDGVEVAEDAASVAELLLAWQDAPYNSAVSEMASGEWAKSGLSSGPFF